MKCKRFCQLVFSCSLFFVAQLDVLQIQVEALEGWKSREVKFMGDMAVKRKKTKQKIEKSKKRLQDAKHIEQELEQRADLYGKVAHLEQQRAELNRRLNDGELARRGTEAALQREREQHGAVKEELSALQDIFSMLLEQMVTQHLSNEARQKRGAAVSGSRGMIAAAGDGASFEGRSPDNSPSKRSCSNGIDLGLRDIDEQAKEYVRSSLQNAIASAKESGTNLGSVSAFAALSSETFSQIETRCIEWEEEVAHRVEHVETRVELPAQFCCRLRQLQTHVQTVLESNG